MYTYYKLVRTSFFHEKTFRLAHSQWVKLNYKRDLQIVVHLLSLSFYKVRVRVTIFFVFKKESYFKIHVACVSSGGVT